jgi:hypothetical protein
VGEDGAVLLNAVTIAAAGGIAKLRKGQGKWMAWIVFPVPQLY